MNAWAIKMQRVGDAHIMDIMINSQVITQKQVRKIDYYQKYLRVTTLVNITTSDGKSIIADVFNGKREKSINNDIISELVLQQQQKPLWRTRELWTSALKSTVSNNAGILHSLLREWFLTTEQQ
eukprot:675341-Ditylum_brightwellii.AAC.2